MGESLKSRGDDPLRDRFDRDQIDLNVSPGIKHPDERTEALPTLSNEPRLRSIISTDADWNVYDTLWTETYRIQKPESSPGFRRLDRAIDRIESVDMGTHVHSQNVANIVSYVSATLGLEQLDTILIYGTALHDIGKISPSIQQLLESRRGIRFTDDDHRVMQMHPILGFRTLTTEAPSTVTEMVAALIALLHHAYSVHTPSGRCHRDPYPSSHEIDHLIDEFDQNFPQTIDLLGFRMRDLFNSHLIQYMAQIVNVSDQIEAALTRSYKDAATGNVNNPKPLSEVVSEVWQMQADEVIDPTICHAAIRLAFKINQGKFKIFT